MLSEAGMRVPEDVGLMGFDNIDTLRHVRPRLATVDQQIAEIGRVAVENLIAYIEGESIPSNIECPYRVLEGESIAPVTMQSGTPRPSP